MNRIDRLFKAIRKNEGTALMPFLVAGDPTIDLTGDLIVAIEEAGADVLELGAPFSDPIADGPTIQAAGQRALASGATLQAILNMVKHVRKAVKIPIVLMSYYNLLYQYPMEKFAVAAADAGIDGVIVPDLPVEEAAPWHRVAVEHGLDTIFLVAPTSPPHRIKKADSLSRGFLYYVSVTGVTGARKKLPANLIHELDSTRKQVRNPVAVGFGIGSAAQVADLAPHADGIIVGSALVNIIARHHKSSGMVKRVKGFIQELKKPLL